jgi:hypothetical protein
VDPLGARPDARGRCARATALAHDRGRGDDRAGHQAPVLFLDRPSAWSDHPVFVHFAGAILENARRQDVSVLTVVGSIEETIADVEEHFAEALARGPKAQTRGKRHALIREANEALVFQVRTGTARPWAIGTAESVTRDFICECDDTDCRAVITISVAQFERAAAEGAVVSCLQGRPRSGRRRADPEAGPAVPGTTDRARPK